MKLMDHNPGTPPEKWSRPASLAAISIVIAVSLGYAILAGYYPAIAVSLPMLIAGAATLYIFVGMHGLTIGGAILTAFLLMQRLDETYGFSIEDIYFRPSFLMFAGFSAALAVAALHGSGSLNPREKPLHRLPGYLLVLWILLACFGMCTIAVNQIWDLGVANRNMVGELAALAMILIPMTFAISLSACRIYSTHLLLCLRFVLFMGGFAGLVMAGFGLFAPVLLKVLGWTSAHGMVDLMRGRLPLGHPNPVCAVMLLMFAPNIVLGWTARNIVWKLAHFACVVFIFCGILFSLSRSALLVALLYLALTGGYLLISEKRHRILLYLLAGVGTVVLAGIALYLFSAYDFSRFWSRRYHENVSVERRADSMRTALYVWDDHPMLGVAPDAVYKRLELRPGWRPPIFDETSPILFYRGHKTAETPHNMYLTALAELGLVGALLLVTALGLLLRHLFLPPGWKCLTAEHRQITIGLGLGLAAFMTIGMTEALLFVPMRPSVVFWIFAGLCCRYTTTLIESDGEAAS